jgi:hypothetical protein
MGLTASAEALRAEAARARHLPVVQASASVVYFESSPVLAGGDP